MNEPIDDIRNVSNHRVDDDIDMIADAIDSLLEANNTADTTITNDKLYTNGNKQENNRLESVRIHAEVRVQPKVHSQHKDSRLSAYSTFDRCWNNYRLIMEEISRNKSQSLIIFG
jgi:hypothetical protein